MANLSSLRDDILELISRGASADDLDEFLEDEGIQVDRISKTIVTVKRAIEEAANRIVKASESLTAETKGLSDKVESSVSDSLNSIASDIQNIAKDTGELAALIDGGFQRVMSANQSLMTKAFSRIDALQAKLDAFKQTDITGLEDKIEALQADVEGRMEKLLKATRVPVRDADGNLIGVKLKA